MTVTIIHSPSQRFLTHQGEIMNATIDSRPATASGTYTSTRSGLAAAAAVVELLRDLPLVSVAIDPCPGDDEALVRIDAENWIAAEVAAYRLGINERDPDPASRYREWWGFSWLNPAEPIYVVVTHDQPAGSAAADRHDRRLRILYFARLILGSLAVLLGGLGVGMAIGATGTLFPLAIFTLGVVLTPTDRIFAAIEFASPHAVIRRIFRRSSAR